MTSPVRHDPELHRFHATVDGRGAELVYRLKDNVMTITHTGVPDEIGGRGIAAALVKAALEHAQASGWKVIPLCSYAAAYMARHPEYAHLRHGQQAGE